MRITTPTTKATDLVIFKILMIEWGIIMTDTDTRSAKSEYSEPVLAVTVAQMKYKPVKGNSTSL